MLSGPILRTVPSTSSKAQPRAALDIFLLRMGEHGYIDQVLFVFNGEEDEQGLF